MTEATLAAERGEVDGVWIELGPHKITRERFNSTGAAAGVSFYQAAPSFPIWCLKSLSISPFTTR